MADVAGVAGVADVAEAVAAVRCARMKKRMPPMVLHLAAGMIRENLVRENRKKRSVIAPFGVIFGVIQRFGDPNMF